MLNVIDFSATSQTLVVKVLIFCKNQRIIPNNFANREFFQI